MPSMPVICAKASLLFSEVFLYCFAIVFRDKVKTSTKLRIFRRLPTISGLLFINSCFLFVNTALLINRLTLLEPLTFRELLEEVVQITTFGSNIYQFFAIFALLNICNGKYRV